jgi:hypothetical protein
MIGQHLSLDLCSYPEHRKLLTHSTSQRLALWWAACSSTARQTYLRTRLIGKISHLFDDRRGQSGDIII